MIKQIGFASRALITAAALAAAAPVPAFAQQADRIPVNVGLPISNYWPAYVARDLKLYEQVGLEPKYFGFTTGAPLIAGMKSGSLDVAWTGLATLFMLGQGIPLKFVLVPLDSSSQMGLVVNPASGISSYKEINKAKNIGAPTATCAEVSLVLAAKKAGIPRSQLKASNLAPNLLLGAMQNGQIDAFFIWGPWNLQARDAGFKIVNWDKDYMRDGGVCATTVAIRPEFLAKNPSVACKMIKAHALAIEAARKDPELAIRPMMQAMGITHKLSKEVYETLEIPSIKSQIEPNTPWSLVSRDAGLSEKLYEAGQALYETKAFTQPLAKDTIWQSIDARYIREYLDTDCKK
jgi:NitT/TauT family transport system substrate-binding protein